MGEAAKFFIELALTLVATFFLTRYQDNIGGWIGRINDNSIMKRKDKAIKEYKYICALRDNHARLVSTLTFHQTTGIFALIMSGVFLIVSYLVIALSFQSDIKTILDAFDLKGHPHPLFSAMSKLPKLSEEVLHVYDGRYEHR